MKSVKSYTYIETGGSEEWFQIWIGVGNGRVISSQVYKLASVQVSSGDRGKYYSPGWHWNMSVGGLYAHYKFAMI